MEFHRVSNDPEEPTNEYNSESENAQWTLRVDRMLFGHRIHLGRLTDGIPNEGYDIDYCAGAHPLVARLLFNLVDKCLTHVPESVSPEAVRRVFLPQSRKPIENDPRLLNLLCILADVPFEPLRDLLWSLQEPQPDVRKSEDHALKGPPQEATPLDD